MELVRAILDAWESIPQEFVKRLIRCPQEFRIYAGRRILSVSIVQDFAGQRSFVKQLLILHIFLASTTSVTQHKKMTSQDFIQENGSLR